MSESKKSPKKPHPAQELRERLKGHRDLPPAQELPGCRPLYLAVLRHWAEYVDQAGEAWPSAALLAQRCMVGYKTVQRALSWAVEVGLLERQAPGYKGHSAVYRAVLPGYAQAATEAGDGAANVGLGSPTVQGQSGTREAPKRVPGVPPTREIPSGSPELGSPKGRQPLEAASPGLQERRHLWANLLNQAQVLEMAAAQKGRHEGAHSSAERVLGLVESFCNQQEPASMRIADSMASALAKVHAQVYGLEEAS